MSHEIEIDTITEILLPDGWHTVEEGTLEITDLAIGETFTTSTGDFFSRHHEIDLGFTFSEHTDTGERITSGPIASIRTIRQPG